MTPPTQQPTPSDPVSLIAAGVIFALGLMVKVWPLLPSVKRKHAVKKDTDESLKIFIQRTEDDYEALEIRVMRLSEENKSLEEKLQTAKSALAIRNDQITTLEKEAVTLRAVANEVESLRAANGSLMAINEQLALEVGMSKKEPPSSTT